MQTWALPIEVDCVVGDPLEMRFDDQAFGLLLAYPGSDGGVVDYRETIAAAKEAGVIVITVCDLLAQVLLESPGSLGADVAIGSTQRFGVPLGFGGPHAAFMATSEAFKRRIPGRIMARGVRTLGRSGRAEQHIRRDRDQTSARRRCCLRSWRACTPSPRP